MLQPAASASRLTIVLCGLCNDPCGHAAALCPSCGLWLTPAGMRLHCAQLLLLG
jgi:hypothetical protein